MVQITSYARQRLGAINYPQSEPAFEGHEMTIDKSSSVTGAACTGIEGPAILINGCYMPPPTDGAGKIWVRTSALVQSDPETLYNLWHDIQLIPQWQEEIVSVTPKGHGISHWVMRSGNKTVEWDEELLADDPGRRITWRSISGDAQNAGEVIFEHSPSGHGTVITVLQEFGMGKLASAWETLVGRNPKQVVIENLRHFKALAETGEIPRTQGQSHGPRGTSASMKSSAYGENIPTPPGTLDRAS
jgi:uncharacterized membrane protein